MKQIVTITGENLNIVTNNVEATAATGKKTKAQMRLEALKAAGVDTSKYFPLGDDQIIKIENGAAVPVDMDDATIDAVGKQIVESGTSAPEGTLLCTGNCTECLKEDRLCWSIGKGQAIGFLAH